MSYSRIARGALALVVVAATVVTVSGRGVSADTGVHAKGGHHDHEHPAVPPAYASAHLPDHVWTDPKMIARGRELYVAKCALCHGEKGDGKGPGAANLPLKPADLTDVKMVAEMPGNFWYWRVSEGGLVEPFKSKGSAMPAWKGELLRRASFAHRA